MSGYLIMGFVVAFVLMILMRVYIKTRYASEKPPVPYLFMGIGMVGVGLMGLTPGFPIIYRLGSPTFIYFGTLFLYFGYQMLYNRRLDKPILQNGLFYYTLIGTLIVLFFDILRGDNASIFMNAEPYIPTFSYYAYNISMDFIAIPLDILLAKFFWEKRRKHRDMEQIFRTYTLSLAFSMASIASILSQFNMLLAIITEKHQINTAINGSYFLFLTGAIIVGIVATLPHSVLWPILRPFANRIKSNENKLIEYLHTRYIKVIPVVQHRPNLLLDDRIGMEIDAARHILWTHHPKLKAPSPREEAKHLITLLAKDHVLTSVGLAVPPPLPESPEEVDYYNLAVARELQALEKRLKHKSPSPQVIEQV